MTVIDIAVFLYLWLIPISDYRLTAQLMKDRDGQEYTYLLPPVWRLSRMFITTVYKRFISIFFFALILKLHLMAKLSIHQLPQNLTMRPCSIESTVM